VHLFENLKFNILCKLLAVCLIHTRLTLNLPQFQQYCEVSSLQESRERHGKTLMLLLLMASGKTTHHNLLVLKRISCFEKSQICLDGQAILFEDDVAKT